MRPALLVRPKSLKILGLRRSTPKSTTFLPPKAKTETMLMLMKVLPSPEILEVMVRHCLGTPGLMYCKLVRKARILRSRRSSLGLSLRKPDCAICRSS